MEEMILRAISLGLQTICFTEHHDINYPDNPDHFDFLLDLNAYKKTLFQLKEKYKKLKVCTIAVTVVMIISFVINLI